MSDNKPDPGENYELVEGNSLTHYWSYRHQQWNPVAKELCDSEPDYIYRRRIVSPWISCKERMPTKEDGDDECCVLGLNKGGKKYVVHVANVPDSSYGYVSWMPIPPLPQPEPEPKNALRAGKCMGELYDHIGIHVNDKKRQQIFDILRRYIKEEEDEWVFDGPIDLSIKPQPEKSEEELFIESTCNEYDRQVQDFVRAGLKVGIKWMKNRQK